MKRIAVAVLILAFGILKVQAQEKSNTRINLGGAIFESDPLKIYRPINGKNVEVAIPAIAADSTVHLQISHAVYEKKDGAYHEVWLKKPNASDAKRKMVTKGGTGFIVSYNSASFIVTAKHVVVDETGRAGNLGTIWLNAQNGKAVSLPVRYCVEAGKQGWFVHRDADLAVLPFWKDLSVDFDVVAIPYNLVSTNRLSMLSAVFAFGFPMGLGVNEVLEPVAKVCQISAPFLTIRRNPKLMTTTNSPPYILLDQALAQGYSGCPIFADVISNPLTPHYRLVGVMSGVQFDATGGKVSWVVPISALADTLQSEGFKAYEKKTKRMFEARRDIMRSGAK